MSDTTLATSWTQKTEEIEIIWGGRTWLTEHAAMRAQIGTVASSSYGQDTDDIVICVGCPSNGPGCISDACSTLGIAPTKETPAKPAK